MATKPAGFYSYIIDNGHHDAWKIIVLVFALVAVFISCRYATDTSVPYYVPTRQQSMTDAQREAFMSAPSGVPADTSMTNAQRTALMMKAVQKVKTDTSLTDAQRRQMMRNQ